MSLPTQIYQAAVADRKLIMPDGDSYIGAMDTEHGIRPVQVNFRVADYDEGGYISLTVNEAAEFANWLRDALMRAALREQKEAKNDGG